MKYFNLATINAALARINDGTSTQEHRPGTVACALAQNYFSLTKFITTPEQIKKLSNKNRIFQ